MGTNMGGRLRRSLGVLATSVFVATCVFVASPAGAAPVPDDGSDPRNVAGAEPDAPLPPDTDPQAGQQSRGEDPSRSSIAAAEAVDGEAVDGEVAPSGVITNGVITLGVNPEGHLNFNAGGDTGVVGLVFEPTGGDAISPGCRCEGWGIWLPQAELAGAASVDNGGGVVGLTPVSFTSDGVSATSVVEIAGAVRITHEYFPSTNPNLYQVDVSVENLSASPSDVIYRRAMDWDVPPTEFDEFVSVMTNSSQVLFSSNDGFAPLDPSAGVSDIGGWIGDFIDAGPQDQGALFDFDLGSSSPGSVNRFTMFYGAAPNVDDGLDSLDDVGATGWSYAYPNTSDGPHDGAPNTFLFGFVADPIRPNFANWHPGDVHTHSAGDAGLTNNPFCDDIDDEDQCAQVLVQRIHDRAEEAGLEWVILTEHGPWLGIVKTTRCFIRCQTYTNMLSWHRNAAERAFGFLEAYASEFSAEGSVRMLMGQEFGGAAAWCGLSTGFRGTGHFGAYYTPVLVPNTQFDCDEAHYLSSLESGGGWGGINHPENGDGGSDWHCYHDSDAEPGPSRCLGEAVDYADNVYRSVDAANAGRGEAFRSMEIINDQHLPTTATLDHWDEMLNDGWRVAAVGGSDAHSAPRSGTDPKPPNDGKIGYAGRTYAFASGSINPSAAFDSGSYGDPIRRSIRTGRTIASNGPLAVPSVNGAFPGDAKFYRDSVQVRIDWPLGSFETIDGSASADDPVTRSVPHAPETIRVVVGKVIPAECPDDDRPCDDERIVIDYEPNAIDRSRGYAVVPVTITGGWELIYVRTEALTGDVSSDGSFPGGDHYEFGAFSSPIYLARLDQLPVGTDLFDAYLARTYTSGGGSEATALALASPATFDPQGTVVDTTGAPVDDAIVTLEWYDEDLDVFREMPDGSPLLAASTRENPQGTGPDGSFGWDVAAGRYRVTARAFGCRAPDGSGSVVVTDGFDVPPPVLDLTLTLDCTQATTASLGIAAGVREVPAETTPVVYDVTCEAADGTIDVREVSVNLGERVEVTDVAVGATCTVVQRTPDGYTALADVEQTTVVGVNGSSVHYFNTTTLAELELGVEVLGATPEVAGTVTVAVECSDDTAEVLEIAVGDLVYVEGVTEGAECEVVLDAGALVPVRYDAHTTEVIAMTLPVVFIVDAALVPLAAADHFDGVEDETLIVAAPGVLGNDTGTGSLNAELVSAPTVGALSLAVDGSFSFEPDPDWAGDTSFTYRVLDADSVASDTVEVTIAIAPVNDVPVANDDHVTIEGGGTVTIDVLANDVDVDSDTLSAELESAPAVGTAVCDAEGCTFTSPSPDWVGTTTFGYAAVDPAGARSVAVVRVEALDAAEPECNIVGTDGSDVLFGTDGPDVICGLGGNDIIFGFGGNDIIRGGDGSDLIFGGSGDDTISGGAGDDIIHGESGNDVISGDEGNDMIFGGTGNDVISGDEGNDMLFGGYGNDVLAGGPGIDILSGGLGEDDETQ